MSQLYECKMDYRQVVALAKFNPFIPIVGTVCTLLQVTHGDQGEGLLFEEVQVSDDIGTKISFDPQY